MRRLQVPILAVQLDDDSLGGNAGGTGDVDPNTLNTSGTLTHTFGNDGGSIAFATSGAPAGYRYTPSGSNVLIQQEQGVGNWVTVATVTLNAATGAYTVTQNAAVVHPLGGAENDVSFTLNYTVTDGDLDTAPGTLVINIDDDTPIAVAGSQAGTVDEDGLANGITVAQTGDVAGAALSATGSVTGLFNAGADTPLTYQLSGSTAGLTALGLTSGGVAVTYALVGNVLTASAGATPVFTLTLNTTTGQWDFVLSAPLDHANGASENDITLAFGNLLHATDRDGDLVDAIGSLTITVDDDSPLVSNVTATGSVSVDETSANPGGFPISANSGTAMISATLAYGADGAAVAGTPAYTLAVTGAAGLTSLATSLVTALGGFAITLVEVNATTLAGQYTNGGTQTAFTLSIDAATGVVTLTQNIALEHNTDGVEGAAHNDVLSLAGLVTATVTITDRDGDSHDGSAQVGGAISFFDDGPSITATGAIPALTVDETVLATDAGPVSFAGVFTTNFGADGGTQIAYALGVVAGASGLIDTATGQVVNLVLNGTVVEGRTAGSNALVFTVTVNASGGVTLDQLRAVMHSPDSGPNQSTTLTAANLVTLTATATDNDGDTDSALVNIGQSLVFLDDAGALGAFVGVTVVNAANVVGSGTFAYTQGADGHGSFAITGPVLPGITYTTVQNANGALLSATTDPDGAGGNPPITVFTLQVNSNGTYDFTLVTPSAASTETISLLGLSAGGPSPFVETAGGRVEFTGNMTGINSSTQGFGVANQFVESGENFTIEFHDPGQVGDQPSTTNPDMVSSIVLQNNSINGALIIRVTVYNDVLGTSEVVYTALNVTGASTTIDPIMNEFNRVFIEGIGGSGQGVRFSALDISRTILPSDIDLQFGITATDRDGDVTSTSTLDVFVDATAPIVLDLDGDGAEFVGISAGTQFDYAGDGSPDSTAWVGSDDGLLALDVNGDGQINNGSEIVFGGNGSTDLEGLAAQYDSNADGVLDANDAGFAAFGVWQDANGDGVSQSGEFRSLLDAGIISISLTSDNQSYTTANGGVVVHGQSSFTRSDGTTGTVADVSFAVRPDTQQRIQTQADTLVAASLIALAGADVLVQQSAASSNPDEAQVREIGVDSTASPTADLGTENYTTIESLALDHFASSGPVQPIELNEMRITQLWETTGLAPQEVPVVQYVPNEPAFAVQLPNSGASMLFQYTDTGLIDALLLARSGPVEQTGATLIEPLHEIVADAFSENGIDHLLNQLTDGPSDAWLSADGGMLNDNDASVMALIEMPIANDSISAFSSVSFADQLNEMATT